MSWSVRLVISRMTRSRHCGLPAVHASGELGSNRVRFGESSSAGSSDVDVGSMSSALALADANARADAVASSAKHRLAARGDATGRVARRALASAGRVARSRRKSRHVSGCMGSEGRMAPRCRCLRSATLAARHGGRDGVWRAASCVWRAASDARRAASARQDPPGGSARALPSGAVVPPVTPSIPGELAVDARRCPQRGRRRRLVRVAGRMARDERGANWYVQAPATRALPPRRESRSRNRVALDAPPARRSCCPVI